jgi:hypothetical protein
MLRDTFAPADQWDDPAASPLAGNLDIVPEMQHIFIKAAGTAPESDAGIARLGAYLRRAFE